MTSFNSHNQDTITNHIDFCFSVYTVCLEVSKVLKKSVFKTIQFLKKKSKESLKKFLLPFWKSISKLFVSDTVTNNTFS